MDIRAHYSLNPETDLDLFENKLSDALSSELRREIDFEILFEVLKNSGWTQVKIDCSTDNNHAIDIQDWVKQTCIGATKNNGPYWVFALEKDAILFLLRWGGNVQ